VSTAEPPRTDAFGSGRYADAVVIGRGSHSVVYRAWQAALERHVAIKVMSAAPDAEALERFERECIAIGALSGHPNIVAVYEVGRTDDGRPFIIMEHLLQSLGARLQDGPLPWPEAVDITIRVAGALQSAHDVAVLHRDVKPENILVSRFGEPKLGDFGIARMEGLAETASGVIRATVVHAAPEVLAGQRPTEASDLYGLASTTYALLSGRPPHVRADDQDLLPVLARITTEPVPDLRPSGVPNRVCVALERALSKDSGDRHACVRDLGEELQAAQVAAGLSRTGLPIARRSPPGRSSDDPDPGPASSDRSVATVMPGHDASAVTPPPAHEDRLAGPDGPVHRRTRRRWPWAVLAAVVVLLIIGAVALLVDDEPTVEVVSVGGQPMGRAEATLERLGLSVRVVEANDDEPVGTVL
jgi:serine/threonine protein kinase